MKQPLFALCISVALLARQEPVFKSATKLVQIYATVVDHGGHSVLGLTRQQFEVLDDGAAQPISVFESTEQAVSCALLLDTTGSMTESIPVLKNTARAFIEALRDEDSLGVYEFSDHLDELAGISTDRAAALRALTRLRASGRTALFDSISQLAVQLDKRPGKKVIVVLTDGGDNASTLNRQAAAQRVRKAGVPLFVVAEGNALHESEAAGLLHQLAEATGGRMYRAATAKRMEHVFTEITEDLRNTYLLAFAAPVEAQSPPWHQLQVEVKNTAHPVRVRARTAYQSQ